MNDKVKYKQIIHNWLLEFNDRSDDADLYTLTSSIFSVDSILNITKPFDQMNGLKEAVEKFWDPLILSFPDLEINPYILIADSYENRSYVSCTGNMLGTFVKDWLGIPAHNKVTWLRFAGHFLIEEEKVVKAWFFIDVLDVMRQVGFNFFPTLGKTGVPPGPQTQDGLVLYETCDTESQQTLDLTNRMLTALGEYDQKTLESMDQTRFWDTRNMMWYGPCGIGTTRGLKGFEKNHQVPFITAFPDRGITEKKDKDYFTQIGDGNYSCDFGFPAMYGTHLNDTWLGLEATGKRVTMRVVDYWRREGNLLKENWVFIDIIDIMDQLGIDVFDLLHIHVSNLTKN